MGGGSEGGVAWCVECERGENGRCATDGLARGGQGRTSRVSALTQTWSKFEPKMGRNGQKNENSFLSKWVAALGLPYV